MLTLIPVRDARKSSLPTPNRTESRRLSRWTLVAWVILAVGLALSIATSASWHSKVQSQEEQNFNTSATDVSATIASLLQRDADLVVTARTFIRMNPNASSSDFTRWFTLMRVTKRYPGANRFSYVERVPRSRLQAFKTRSLAEHPEANGRFNVMPAGSRASYCLSRVSVVGTHAFSPIPGQFVDFCQPGSWGDTKLGLTQSLRTGKLTATSGVPEIFYMYLPVYRGGAVPTSVAQRNARLTGWIHGMFYSDAMFETAIGNRKLLVELWRRNGNAPAVQVSTGGTVTQGTVRHRTLKIDADGEWTLRVSGPVAGGALSARSQAAGILFAGLLVSFLLFALMKTLSRSRFRALRLVDQRTAELRSSESRFRSLAASSPIGIMQIDAEGNYKYGNERLQRILGLSAEQVEGHGWLKAFPEVDRIPMLEAVRTSTPIESGGVEQFVHAAEPRWVMVSAAPMDDEDDRNGFVVSVEDVTIAHDVKSRLSHEARHDPLTGLPNRLQFIELLSQAIHDVGHDNTQVAVLFIDLDRFKQVNDVLGHAAGDELLVETARRISSTLRGGDVLARHGGDEFTVLAEGIERQSEILALIERIHEVMSAPLNIAQRHDITIGASIGLVMVTDPTQSPEAVIQDADMAMYHAKRGSSRFEIFNESLREHSVTRLETEQAMRTAIEREEFVLAYQPIMNLENGQIHGAEALLRWRHPTRGLLHPHEFLPLAESTGLVIPIGEWVVRSALGFAARSSDDLKVSINVSAQQLANENFVPHLQQLISENRVRPDRVCLEVLETHVLNDDMLIVLDKLKKLGVGIGIDDFGTGYSSLTYLKRFPIDVLKIDRSFVADLTTDNADLTILTKIVELAHAFDIAVVAEGVDAGFQVDLVRSAECDFGQGDLWSAPLLEDDFNGLYESLSNGSTDHLATTDAQKFANG